MHSTAGLSVPGLGFQFANVGLSTLYRGVCARGQANICSSLRGSCTALTLFSCCFLGKPLLIFFAVGSYSALGEAYFVPCCCNGAKVVVLRYSS
jgi:hypothetical protein